MTRDIKLVAPLVLVIRDPGEPLEVQTDNRDLLAWESTALRHKWGSFQDRPFKWLTFLAWSALRRSGDLETSLTYEAWETQVRSVRDIGNAENGVGPTEAGPETD
jgi:hypothetical protein